MTQAADEAECLRRSLFSSATSAVTSPATISLSAQIHP